MKFVSYILEDVEGIRIFYYIGLFIFIIFFLNVLYKTFKMPKQEAEDLKNSLFDEEEKETIEKEQDGFNN